MLSHLVQRESIDSRRLQTNRILLNFHISYPDPSASAVIEQRISYLEDWQTKSQNFLVKQIQPFDKVFIVGKGTMEWLVKRDPVTDDVVRVNVELQEKSERFLVSVETIALLNMLNSDLGSVFVLEEKPLIELPKTVGSEESRLTP